MSKEFYTTRTIFREYVNAVSAVSNEPLSYEDWIKLPSEYKSAALYVQFFDEIILAWYKCKTSYASDEEGVETIMQYLEKNVPTIVNNRRRYSPNYIYRVAFNCLYCICHDRVVDKKRAELEHSNIVITSEGEVDVFDTLIGQVDVHPSSTSSQLWAIVDSLGDDANAVVSSLIEGIKLPRTFGRNHRKDIIEQLKVQLEPFKKYYY